MLPDKTEFENAFDLSSPFPFLFDFTLHDIKIHVMENFPTYFLSSFIHLVNACVVV